MTTRKQFVTVTMLTSIAISLGAFGMISTIDFSTDTEKLYGPSGIGSYIDTDPEIIKEKTNLILKGKLVGIENVFEYWDENANTISKNDPEVRAKVAVTFYTVKVDDVIKGNYDSDIVTIRSLFGTHVNYQEGDTVIAMLSDSENGDMLPWGGPHGMYKIQNGKAIGHEKTLPEQRLYPIKG